MESGTVAIDAVPEFEIDTKFRAVVSAEDEAIATADPVVKPFAFTRRIPAAVVAEFAVNVRRFPVVVMVPAEVMSIPVPEVRPAAVITASVPVVAPAAVIARSPVEPV
jgi:hypothetical protein